MAPGQATAFEARVVPCDYAELAQVKADAEALIAQMQFTRSYAALRLLHVQLQFLTLTDAWAACKHFLNAHFLELAPHAVTFANQTTCPDGSWNYPTDTYLTSPCCSLECVDLVTDSYNSWLKLARCRNTINQCCAPHDIALNVTEPVAVQTDALNAECTIAECSQYSFFFIRGIKCCLVDSWK